MNIMREGPHHVLEGVAAGVAHEVGYDGGVPWIVLGDAHLNLSD